MAPTVMRFGWCKPINPCINRNSPRHDFTWLGPRGSETWFELETSALLEKRSSCPLGVPDGSGAQQMKSRIRLVSCGHKSTATGRGSRYLSIARVARSGPNANSQGITHSMPGEYTGRRTSFLFSFLVVFWGDCCCRRPCPPLARPPPPRPFWRLGARGILSLLRKAKTHRVQMRFTKNNMQRNGNDRRRRLLHACCRAASGSDDDDEKEKVAMMWSSLRGVKHRGRAVFEPSRSSSDKSFFGGGVAAVFEGILRFMNRRAVLRALRCRRGPNSCAAP